MNKNLSLFRERFPQLSEMFAKEESLFLATGGRSGGESSDQEHTLPYAFTVQESRSKALTALHGATPLHSKYNPEREAAQLIQDFTPDSDSTAVCLGFGLGYVPLALAAKFPSLPLVLVEEDPLWLYTAFCFIDWTAVLTHKDLVFALKAPPETLTALLGNRKPSGIRIFAQPAQTAHAQEYFEASAQEIRRLRQKEEINTNTLEAFSHLWLRNSCRNLGQLGSLSGAGAFFGLVKTDLPFLVIAAGPSLEQILPKLSELHERTVTVCVDTALHACLKAGVEPDFVVLVDPQYWCARHLDFLSAPNSTLITESAAWPSVFRFDCRRKVLCSSLFPLGQYFERHIGEKGRLAAGGSVTTTAWDFARKCGARRIYIAGMDLGFPGKQTHIRGSQFEERAHRHSTRIFTAEQDSAASLFGANPQTLRDYNGNPLLSDKRMSVFSWWFQNSVKVASEEGQETYSLTASSLAIPGIEYCPAENLLAEEPRPGEKREFLCNAEERLSSGTEATRRSFEATLENFTGQMQTLRELSRKARNLAQKGLADRTKAQAISAQLSQIDRQIMNSQAKEAASLVFPTERQLKELTRDLSSDPLTATMQYSRIIYTELEKAVDEYLGYIMR